MCQNDLEMYGASCEEEQGAPGSSPILPCNNAGIRVVQVWKEYHVRQQPSQEYSGVNDKDRKIIEHEKSTLHLCFQEEAIITLDVSIDDGGEYYAWWRIVDDQGNLVVQHVNFSETNYTNSSDNAKLRQGRYGWHWDGKKINNRNRVFCSRGVYRSRVTVKSASGEQVEVSDCSIELQGEPYRIFVIGQPKNDQELTEELNNKGRLLSTDGERTARDCWILVYRGQEDDGHTVFLGQGTQEATTANLSPKYGAIATPHGRYYKGWTRINGKGVRVIEIEDLGRQDGRIRLINENGPAPNNPYCDTVPNGTYKDGVQAHGGNRNWTSNGLSVGCTTISPVAGSTNFNKLISTDATLGETKLDPKDYVFFNKQRASLTDDAELDFSHAWGGPIETPLQPPHMQSNFLDAVLGGYSLHEITRNTSVADDPVDSTRIRMCLRDYMPGTKYYLYHHAVVFGHSGYFADKKYKLEAWFPRKIIRGWNGNMRNVLVRGGCQIRWYIKKKTVLIPYANQIFSVTPGAAEGHFIDLPELGMIRREGQLNIPDEWDEYLSIIDYRLRLGPSDPRADHDWVVEEAMDDLFSRNEKHAELAHEKLEEGAHQQQGWLLLVGTSSLSLTHVTLPRMRPSVILPGNR